MPRGRLRDRVGTDIPASLPPSGPAGGDLAGTYPNPTVDGLQGRSLSAAAPNVGDAYVWTGALWLPTAVALAATTITAGAGMTGGGDLSTNRTLDVVANADDSIAVGANDVGVGVLATDAQHGNRGGG